MAARFRARPMDVPPDPFAARQAAGGARSPALVALARLLPVEGRDGVVGPGEATGDARFREPYERRSTWSLRTWASFLPGHPEREQVMDRLHAFLYFLEGLLPRAGEPRCAAALSRRHPAGGRATSATSRRSSSAPTYTPNCCASACMPIGPARCRSTARPRGGSPEALRVPGGRADRGSTADSVSDARAAKWLPLPEPGVHGVRHAGAGAVARVPRRRSQPLYPAPADLEVAARDSRPRFWLAGARWPGVAPAPAHARTAGRPAPAPAGISVVIPSRNGRICWRRSCRASSAIWPACRRRSWWWITARTMAPRRGCARPGRKSCWRFRRAALLRARREPRDRRAPAIRTSACSTTT